MQQALTISGASRSPRGRAFVLTAAACAFAFAYLLASVGARAQTPGTQAASAQPSLARQSSEQISPDTIGRLSGDEMTVTRASNLVTANGRSSALLSNGSEITLRLGQAKIELADGGEIDLCAPAHLTLLKAGGAITVAVDYGRVHVQLDSDIPLTVYTPLIVATPVAIGQSRRDITIGLDQKDVMCALAAVGAARIEQQFSGQAILLPQGGELSLTGGQLNGAQMGTQGCQCDLPATRDSVYAQLDVRAPLGPIPPPTRPASAAPIGPASAAPSGNDPSGPNGGYATYVAMPAITFGGTAPEPPPGTDAQTMLLVREVRVQPGLIYQGVVADAAAASTPPSSASAKKSAPPLATSSASPSTPSPTNPSSTNPTSTTDQAKSQKPGFWARIFGGHKNLPRCAGVGCPASN